MLISILGGLGLFLLGMWVMTEGLRALAGSALRSLLRTAAATPARGTWWGAILTLGVQSSSATIMTTIGLVSAGLLTFPQALGVVLGANIGTTGTGWLVATLGVKISLVPVAMPLLFLGALLRLVGPGRWGGAGGAVAGLSLLLLGLTTLQQGMAGLAERVQPADLPAAGGVMGVAGLVVAGIVMTTAMQSSSASVAATISALHAGAIGPDQAAALVIGQNVGTAISSSLAAIGARTAAKRTALAHVLFNVVTAAVALACFPFVAPWLVRSAKAFDAPMLIAGFHTAYNLLGVALLLPVVGGFARLVERMLPRREPELTRFLDRASLGVPGAAVEAARRTVAGAMAVACGVVGRALRREAASSREVARARRDVSEALEQTRLFLSERREPPSSRTEGSRLADVLHALDHAARLAERAEDWASEDRSAALSRDGQAARAAAIAAEVLGKAAAVAGEVAAPRGPRESESSVADASAAANVAVVAAGEGLSRELADLRRSHRARVLEDASRGESPLTAAEAIDHVEAVRLLDKLTLHAWRGVAHLVGVGVASETGPFAPADPPPAIASEARPRSEATGRS